MLGAFSSEWVKLRRRSMLAWGFGAGLFFPLLATILTIERAEPYPRPFIGTRGHIAIWLLEQPTGLVHGVNDVSSLIGIVSLCLFAAAFSIEYSQGTLRNLLVREPRRGFFLAGKFAAMVSFILIVVIVSIGISVAVAFVLAPGKGISTSAWTSGTGLNDLFQAVFHAFLAASFYGVFGAALGILLRSPAVSIPVAVIYFLPIEAIIVGAGVWSGGNNWLPAHLLVALAHGGNGDSTYYHALLMLAVYSVAIAAAIVTLFRRRDA